MAPEAETGSMLAGEEAASGGDPPAPGGPGGPDGPAPQQAAGRRRADRAFLLAVGTLTAVIVVVAVLFGVRLATRSTPPGVSNTLANLMGLDKLVTPRPAPGFALVDQDGRRVAMSSLRGKVVVLEFMDPHCTDICPIVSQEFRRAYADLSPAERQRVEFVAVNVNRFYESTAAMEAFTREQGLADVPTWHFVTGTTAALEKVWRSYGVFVYAPSLKKDVVHTSVVYWISPKGLEVALASPADLHRANGSAYLPAGEEAAWGKGIATEAVAAGA